MLRANEAQIILLCSRQAGKSTASALLALHTALYAPPALILLLAPALRQAQELFRVVKTLHQRLSGLTSAVAEESALRLELANGSRIITLPGTEGTVRGYSAVSLLIVDEASRVPDELYQAVRPMLAVSGGRLVLLSTPFGRRGFFSSEWSEGGPQWARVRIAAEECPRISTDFLARERASVPYWVFRQEYGCEFVDPVDTVFRSADIEGALDDTITPLFGDDRVSDRREYFVGLDLGQAADYTTLAIVERSAIRPWDARQYAVRYLQRWPLGTPYPVLVDEVAGLMLGTPLKRAAKLLIDATGVGRAVTDLFRSAGFGVEVVAVTITAGLEVRGDSGGQEYRVPKRDLVGVVSVLLQHGRLKIAKSLPEAATLVNELREFRVRISDAGRDSYGAWRDGTHDDMVLATALALWYAEHGGAPGSWLAYIGGRIVNLGGDDPSVWPLVI